MTHREKELLEYLIDFKQTNGFSPTVEEIKQGLNTKSTQHIQIMLESLFDKGYITYIPELKRTIVVLRFADKTKY